MKIKLFALSFLLFSSLLFATSVSAQSATLQVSTNSDDANQDGTTLSLNDSNMWLGTGGSATQSYTGLRFQNVQIPKDAQILNAYLQVKSAQNQWNNIGFQMYAEAADNSATFSTTSKISTRALTASVVSYSANVNWTTNTWYNLSNISPVVQEVINRPGWVNGNSLSIVLKGTGNAWGRKFIKSRNSGATNGAKLVIQYTTTSTPTPTPTPLPTVTPTPVPTPSPTPIPTPTPVVTPTPTAPPVPTIVPTATPIPTATPVPTPTPTPVPGGAYENFDGTIASWLVTKTGSITQSSEQFVSASSSAKATTVSANQTGYVSLKFTDAGASHIWNERPGTFQWNRARLFIPSSTLTNLGATNYLTIGRIWSDGGYGWQVRVKQNGELFVVGRRDWDNTNIEFKVYGQVPQDQWFDLELGLHSQAGPGTKRAFAFTINGDFYGWYRQGKLGTENYNSFDFGIVETNSAGSLAVYVDDVFPRTTGQFPSGLDTRSTASVTEKDFRDTSGKEWQIDWTTWGENLVLNSTTGLSSLASRVQSGKNIDRLPDITQGWAEIEIGWTGATPTLAPQGYFGPMVGMRKEINREENLEIIPIGRGAGAVDLVYEAWAGGGPVQLATWPLPLASVGGGSHIPESGDIIRTRWTQETATDVRVRVDYFDASSAIWYTDVINTLSNLTNINGVNYNDGFHKASSVTIDSTQYSIKRFKVGTIDTYPVATP